MLELLNNVQHRDLRVHSQRGARWGDAHMSCPVSVDEFRALQPHYPIVFQADGQGSFLPVALLGLAPGQNVYLSDDDWDADYIPLAIRRMPFSIGIDGDELRMMVDMASPRIARDDADGADGAETVFLPQGGQSDYIKGVNDVLRSLHEGMQATPEFIAALQQHGLLEPFELQFENARGERGRLQGLHTVHEERLAALDGATVALLHQADYLQPIYLSIASLANLNRLLRGHLQSQTSA